LTFGRAKESRDGLLRASDGFIENTVQSSNITLVAAKRA